MFYKFEWNNVKATINIKKHGVSFEEARTVFDDEYSVTFNDPDHSIQEFREITIGLSIKNRLLLVFSTERNNIIRIFLQEKRLKIKGKNMNNSNKNKVPEDFMREEYEFDYSKGVVGKYARNAIESNGYIKLTPELQKIFKTSEDVNNALNAVITAIPKTKRKASGLV